MYVKLGDTQDKAVKMLIICLANLLLKTISKKVLL